jgi:membrane-associated phospholipid phosphatase
MFAGLENGLGLEIVVWLQAHGSPLLDLIAQAIHLFGAPGTYLLLLLPLLVQWRRFPLVTDAIFQPPKEAGIQPVTPVPINYRLRVYQWVFTVVVTILFTDVLKLLFHAPRPYQVAPELVRLLVVQRSNYGFPSGHVAIAMAMVGLAVWWSGRRWLWLVALAFTSLVGWARMYAGVHYPQDVLGGVVVGLLSLLFSLRYFDWFIQMWWRTPLVLRLVLVAVGLFLVLNVPGI